MEDLGWEGSVEMGILCGKGVVVCMDIGYWAVGGGRMRRALFFVEGFENGEGGMCGRSEAGGSGLKGQSRSEGGGSGLKGQSPE
jgi:hypothetical protein